MAETTIEQMISADFGDIRQRAAVKRDAAERLDRCADAIAAACAALPDQNRTSQLAKGGGRGGEGLARWLHTFARAIRESAAMLDQAGQMFGAALDKEERELAGVKQEADRVPTESLLGTTDPARSSDG